MSKKTGSVLGGALLVAGSCVGAGMLGLPIQTGLSGLLPSFISFLFVWAFMLLTGFFLVEVQSWHPKTANLLTLISGSLGKTSRYIGWVFYLFLFYALLVAYMAASGNILSHFMNSYLNIDIKSYQATFFFVLLFGMLIYQGTKIVDHANRFLMFFKILAFLLVLVLGARFIKSSQLLRFETLQMSTSIPILITAFGFHNMIPSLNQYLGGNTKRVKKSIVLGSLCSLFIYLLWQILILGVIPLDGTYGLQNALSEGREASELLSLYIQKPSIGIAAQVLGFFAILTSFLAQSLSLSHFLQDGLSFDSKTFSRFGAILLTLIPPLFLALFYPDLFYIALNFAGGICTVVLFGIIPSLLLWKGRYVRGYKSQGTIVPGGRIIIAAVLSFSASVFLYELFNFTKLILV